MLQLFDSLSPDARILWFWIEGNTRVSESGIRPPVRVFTFGRESVMLYHVLPMLERVDVAIHELLTARYIEPTTMSRRYRATKEAIPLRGSTSG